MSNLESSDAKNQRFLKQVGRRALSETSALRKIGHYPSSLEYFIHLMEQVFVRNSVPNSLMEDERRCIGVYCVMVPEALIYAAGAIPVRLCSGSFEASRLGEDSVPRDGCPVVKASLGFSIQNGLKIFRRCDVAVVPTTCDAKRKLGEELSQNKEVWMLEVPHIKESEFGRRTWLNQVYAFKKKVEAYSANGNRPKKISACSLEKALGEITAAQIEARRLMAFRKRNPPIVWGRLSMLATNAYAYDEVTTWTSAMRRLNDELEDETKKGMSVCKPNTPRIMLAGSPVIFPAWKIPSVIETVGGLVVCDESCVGDRYLYDPIGHWDKTLHDRMIGIAARHLMPCICPSFSSNADRLKRLGQMAEDYRVDGIVYHVLKGCINYDFELNRVEQYMKKKSIPILRVETDYNPEDVEQLRTRLEAFVEMLKGKKSSRE